MAHDFKQVMFTMFEQLQRNAVYLAYQPAAEPVAMGRSKIGGRPDLPADFVWPYYEGKGYLDETPVNRPLTFMTQINLAEASEFDKENLLPKKGLLTFFYELHTEKWGFDPADKGCARVYYFADTSVLMRCEFPADLEAEYQLPEFAVTLANGTELPDCGNFMYLPLTQDIPRQFPEEADNLDWDDYEEMRAEYGCTLPEDGWSETTKLLGWPNVIQNPMEFQCEKVSRGIYDGTPQETAEDLQAEIEQASQDWLLLFQMGTVENGDFELMFGDVGHIYFWIKKRDLAALNFDNVWLILQCS